MGYNVQANNRQIYWSIIANANFRDQMPESSTFKVEFLGRRTQELHEKKSPAMVITYNSEDLIYTSLKVKAALRGNQKYNRVNFRKSVPPEYKNAYTNMDRIRQSF